jgi:hypothetical protein
MVLCPSESKCHIQSRIQNNFDFISRYIMNKAGQQEVENALMLYILLSI